MASSETHRPWYLQLYWLRAETIRDNVKARNSLDNSFYYKIIFIFAAHITVGLDVLGLIVFRQSKLPTSILKALSVLNVQQQHEKIL